MVDSCLYHGDKSIFDQIQKDLQTSKWISRNYVHRLAMAVCGCRKNKKDDKPSIEDLEKWQKKVLHFIARQCTENGTRTISSRLKSFILECVKLVNITDYSCCRFLEILYNASVKDFTLLYRSELSSNESVVPETKPVKKTEKLSPQQVIFIIKKRKKKMTSRVIQIPMFPGNTRSMEGCMVMSLQEFAKKHNCYLEWEKTMNNKSMENNNSVTFVRMWTNDIKCYKTVSEELIQHGAIAQKMANQEKERRKERKRQRREHTLYLDSCEELDKGTIWDEFQKKDNMAEDYERRQWKKINDKKTSKKEKVDSSSSSGVVSKLEGGHCLLCLKPYTGLCDTSVCQYHEGFIVPVDNGLIWNCCGQPCDDIHATAEQHLDTGCMFGDQHTWRPRAKSYGKVFDCTNTRGRVKKRVVKHKYLRLIAVKTVKLIRNRSKEHATEGIMFELFFKC